MKIELAANTEDSQAFIDSLALLASPFLNGTEDRYPVGLETTLEKALPFATKCQLSSIWKRLIKYSVSGKKFENNDPLISAGTDLADYLKSPKKVQSNLEISAEDIRYCRAWSTYWRTESEPSQKSFLDLIGKCASTGIKKLFISNMERHGDDQKSLIEERIKIAKQITKGKSNIIDVSIAKQAKADSPEAYSKYLEVNRKINALTKDAIKSLTRQNGKMDVKQLTKKLKSLGLTSNIPVGFEGMMDEKGYYTSYGEYLDGTPVGDVLMNPEYTEGSSKYYAKCKAPGAKGFQSIYTLDARKQSTQQKFQKVQDSIKGIEKAKKIWRKDMYSNNPNKIELGVILEIMYICPPRVGGKGNKTDGKETFGLTTIMAKNIKVLSKSVVLQYAGKKGMEQKNKIVGTDKYSKFVVAYLTGVKEDSKPNDEVFSVSAKDINDYIKNSLRLPISSHKFRTMRGTLLMEELLESKKFGQNPDAKKVNDFINECAMKVGDILGHQVTKATGETKTVGSTALQYYIDPTVVFNFLVNVGVRPNATLEKIFRKANLM